MLRKFPLIERAVVNRDLVQFANELPLRLSANDSRRPHLAHEDPEVTGDVVLVRLFGY
jgi:hypothetical protein